VTKSFGIRWENETPAETAPSADPQSPRAPSAVPTCDGRTDRNPVETVERVYTLAERPRADERDPADY